MVKKKSKKSNITTKKKSEKCCESGNYNCSASDVVYGLGFIGAAVYYISIATGFWNGAWGVLKAMVWPAFVVYKFMQSLGL